MGGQGEGPSGGAVLPGQGVVVGQPVVAHLDVVDGDGAVGLGVEDGLGRDVVAVGAHDGREGPELDPAGVELVVLAAARESAQVAVHVGDAAHRHVEQDGHLGAQAVEAALDVARPGEGAVALHPDVARADQVEEAAVGVLLPEVLVHELGPEQREDVVDLLGGAHLVPHRLGVVLGLAQVGPEAGDAFLDQVAVEGPHPFPGLGLREVDQARAARPEAADDEGRAVLRGGQQALLREGRVVVAAGGEVGLRDQDGLDPGLVEVCDHLLVVGPERLVPAEVAHVVGRAEPEQVEHQGVERHPGFLELADDGAGVLLVLVAVARLDEAQGPLGRQRLRPGELVVARQQVVEVRAEEEVVVDDGVAGVEVHPLLVAGGQVQEGLLVRVEQHGVALGRDVEGRGDVQGALSPGVAVVGLVIDVQALAPQVQLDGPRARAVEMLVGPRLQAHATLAELLIDAQLLAGHELPVAPEAQPHRVLGHADLVRAQRQRKVLGRLHQAGRERGVSAPGHEVAAVGLPLALGEERDLEHVRGEALHAQEAVLGLHAQPRRLERVADQRASGLEVDVHVHVLVVRVAGDDRVALVLEQEGQLEHLLVRDAVELADVEAQAVEVDVHGVEHQLRVVLAPVRDHELPVVQVGALGRDDARVGEDRPVVASQRAVALGGVEVERNIVVGVGRVGREPDDLRGQRSPQEEPGRGHK